MEQRRVENLFERVPTAVEFACLQPVSDHHAEERAVVHVTVADKRKNAESVAPCRLAVEADAVPDVLASVGDPVELTVCVGPQTRDAGWVSAVTAAVPRWRDSLRRVLVAAGPGSTHALVRAHVEAMRVAANGAGMACCDVSATGL